MRQLFIIALLFFCLNESSGQATILDKKVTLKATNVTLEHALNTLQKRYRVHFSYTNNLIPLQQKVSISVKDQPLDVVLKQLFSSASVSFHIVGDQIVLHTSVPKINSSAGETQESRKPSYPPVSQIPTIEPILTSSGTGGTEVPKEVQVVPVPVPTRHLSRQERRRMRLQALSTQVQEKVQEAGQTLADAVPKGSGRTGKVGTSDRKTIPTPSDSGNTANADTLQAVPVPTIDTTTHTSLTDTSTSETRLVQVTLVPPIGSNGTMAGKITNHLSINILAGYARGLEGVEFGGFANLEKEDVKGVQMAGFLNANGGDLSGAQFGGFANLTRGNADGAQFAGFINATRGHVTTGGQFAGFINIAGGNVSFVQAAGFINVAGQDVKGAQMAGFINTTKGNVEGIQMAGFINLARRVKGVQLGILNIADSVDGVQIGLLSFSRHGYRRVEVWGSETLYANAAFKMGSSYFHNIFSFGYRWGSSQPYLGFGYGIGSELPLTNRLSVNLDAIAWQVEVAQDTDWFRYLNMLNQLRATVSLRLGKHTALFAGPTYNVYVTEAHTEGSFYAMPVPDWSWYDRTAGRTRVVMWIGANAGIRF